MPGPAGSLWELRYSDLRHPPRPGAFGLPQPSPPLPFSAPSTVGLAPSVMVAGRPAVGGGSTGFNTPPQCRPATPTDRS